ncbi:hypothetical protein DRO47_06405 [Candidatus Bathyarchaeota archaeon]|nr:MAG: hypothetical protein DRO47_06405 [Candidatus Bathyarchaeota archaeon]
MLEVNDEALRMINSSIDEVLTMINESEDIRKIIASLPKIGHKIRAMAEIKDTPDNRFLSFIIGFLIATCRAYLEDKEMSWYELNKETLAECTIALKNFLTNLKSAINEKSFEKAIDAAKMFYYEFYQKTLSFTA